MNGKTCVVTGSTAGIGEVTALELARGGAMVILVSRDPQRLADTTARIQKETGNPAVEFLPADLSAQAQVRSAAQEILSRCERLDVLVNNAGAFFMRRQESVDGIEMTWALNHLSYFLLTNLLLDLLIASAPARIVNVSSDAHRGAKINFSDPEAKRKFAGFQAYGQSKLANILFTFELARRLEGTGVTANVLHPGFVATRFGKNNGGLVTLGMGLLHRFFALSPEQGARTSLYLAASPEVEGITGKYFVKERSVRAYGAAYDREAAERLWEISAANVGLPLQAATRAAGR